MHAQKVVLRGFIKEETFNYNFISTEKISSCYVEIIESRWQPEPDRALSRHMFACMKGLLRTQSVRHMNTITKNAT